MDIRILSVVFLVLFFVGSVRANNYAPAQDINSHQWGYIDSNGAIVVPFKYKLAFNFQFDKAIVFSDRWYYINKSDFKVYPLDSFLQQYYNKLSDSLIYKTANDSILDWSVMMNILDPGSNNLYYRNWSEYDLFHLCSENTIVVDQSYLLEGFSRSNYVLYDLHKGVVEKSKSISMLTPIVNRSFIGELSKFDKQNSKTQEILGVFSTLGELEMSLETIRVNLTQKIKRHLHQQSENEKTKLLYMYVLTAVGDSCTKIQIEIMPDQPDPIYSIDTQFVFIAKTQKLVSISKSPNMQEKGKVTRMCNCRNSAFNYRETAKKEAYFKYSEKDSFFIDSKYLDLDNRTLLFPNFLSDCYYKNPVEQILYPFYELEVLANEKTIFKCGVWDGVKVVVQPTYRLIGVFN